MDEWLNGGTTTTTATTIFSGADVNSLYIIGAPRKCSCPSRAVLDESNAPLAQQFTPVLVVGDILQAVFVGHTLPEIPPPPARGALELVVGTKTLPAAVLEVVAVPLLPVFAFKAMPAQQ